MKKTYWSVPAFIFFLIILVGCEKEITGERNANIPPETTVFIQGEDTLNFTQSVQQLFWDGRDADGFITGFYYTFSENPQPGDWIFTTEYSGIFPLEITGRDTTYLFQVKALDNDGAEDPTPASQLIPIKNSPPKVEWEAESAIPDTTFTIASFAWRASDPDGDLTIQFIEYALDDTTNWVQIPGTRREISLGEADGIVEGLHAFYLRALDIAGARSNIIRMPENPDNFWYVKAPRGRYLLIDDYTVESSISGFPDAFYKNMLSEFLTPLGEEFTYWNIEDQFPASVTQFKETLKLFERVIWYTDLIVSSDPHFLVAQIAVPEFRQQGGKIIYTVQFNTNFGSQGEPLAFTPVESLGKAFSFISTNSIYYPAAEFSTAFPTLPALPELKVSSFILGVIALQPKASSVPMYRYDEPNTNDDPIFIMTGQNDNTREYDFVFSGTPLHLLRGNNNVEELFEIILFELFGN
jgi:hypothetical protein